jgi:hypothetical protein
MVFCSCYRFLDFFDADFFATVFFAEAFFGFGATVFFTVFFTAFFTTFFAVFFAAFFEAAFLCGNADVIAVVARFTTDVFSGCDVIAGS